MLDRTGQRRVVGQARRCSGNRIQGLDCGAPFGLDRPKNSLGERPVGNKSAYLSASLMSALARTMSMFDKSARKNGHSSFICFRSRIPSFGEAPVNAFTAEPKPNQPGKAVRDCPQEKLQGMARRSSMRSESRREAGREPIFRPEISLIGVAAKIFVEPRRFVNQGAVGLHARFGELLRSFKKALRNGVIRREQRRFDRGRGEGFEVPPGYIGVGIFGGITSPCSVRRICPFTVPAGCARIA